MIYVSKPAKLAPAILMAKNKEGAIETQRMIQAFIASKKKKSTGKIDYAAYRDPSVRSALEKIFRGKCAYCESYVKHVAFGDIEHFRPKKKISTLSGSTHGYYWLGADWDNLLYSCELCNRKKRYPAAQRKFISMGKQNQFPLRNGEKYRCTSHTQRLSKEEKHRLLLHPCKDAPEKHFAYDFNGNIMPRKKGDDAEPARTTIQVVVLQRAELVKERKKHYLKNLAGLIRDLDKFFTLYQKARKAGKKSDEKFWKDLVRERIIDLRSRLAPSEPYLGMTRFLLAPVFQKYNIKI